uniref:Uncharacterized protein n=1 Tax=Eutreptiella gymnastica TaxID=73025 RepID=A0A7S1JDR7_9EUGL
MMAKPHMRRTPRHTQTNTISVFILSDIHTQRGPANGHTLIPGSTSTRTRLERERARTRAGQGVRTSQVSGSHPLASQGRADERTNNAPHCMPGQGGRITDRTGVPWERRFW